MKAPEQSVTRYDSKRAYGGYTLFSPHATKDVWLIDMTGRIVHHWEMPTRLGSDVRLLPNGNQIRVNKTYTEPTGYLGTVGGQLVEVDWDGNVVWKHDDLYLHHDFIRLQNGNTILSRHVLVPDNVARTIKGGIPGTEYNGKVWGEAYREITPEGKTVWEWLGYEHLDPDIDVSCGLCPRSIWGYVNGIDVLPNGDIVGSFRHLNSLITIDRKTGNVKWRWGRWEMGHQHHPTVLGNGNILVFDNGHHRLPDYEHRFATSLAFYSQVLEINPATNKIEWKYKGDFINNFWSPICSSAERLPNGNTLICESTSGRIFELTPEKDIVWEFVSPFYDWHDSLGMTNYIFRAHRYGYDYDGLKGSKLDPERFELVLKEKNELFVE